jgi:7-cyano-7-deazaguanine synthase
MNSKNKAIVLLSGGIDSTTTLAIAKHEGFDVCALSFDYGQRHRRELRAAELVASVANVLAHVTMRCDLRVFGGSALTDGTVNVPKDGPRPGIPATYVPARNTIFLSYALAWAEKLDIRDIFIGANALDYSGYPDCRPAYISAFEDMARLASLKPISIHAPLIAMTKADIIRKGLELGVDYSGTYSCYEGRAKPCNTCDACRLRAQGFADVQG